MTSFATILALFLIILATPTTSHAHACGPAEITVKIGEAKLWRITADRTETTTSYIPTLHPLNTGGPIVAEVTPNFPHLSEHGDFIIRGLQTGTNVLQVQWSYLPTSAAGICVVVIRVVAPPPGETTTQTPRGDGLVTTGNDTVFIASSAFRSMIDSNIPASTRKLLVLSQCYAGNVANSSFFRNMPNTCILSATSPNQLGHYGGYHDDAARTLAPVTGRTAAQVHQAGVNGRFSLAPPPPGENPDDDDTIFSFSEFPMTSGSIAPPDFSLEPVTPEGNVRSRHIVVYAGRPSSLEEAIEIHGGHTVPVHKAPKVTVSDNMDRDRIIQNFAGQPNTSVTTAGGNATDGWQFPGSAAGLLAAIQKAGDEIKKSPRPDLEQFILFMGDHGEQGNTTAVQQQNRVVPPNSRSGIVSGFDSFSSQSAEVQHMEQDTWNTPRLGLFLSFDQAPLNHPPGTSPLFAPNELELQVTSANQRLTTLTSFHQTTFDLDADNIIGNLPGEGLAISFPVRENLFFHSFLDTQLDIDLVNRSSRELLVDSVHILTGEIERARGGLPRPKLSNFQFAQDGRFEMLLQGRPGETYIIQSSDLSSSTWSEITRVQVDSQTRSLLLRLPPSTPPGPTIYRATLLE